MELLILLKCYLTYLSLDSRVIIVIEMFHLLWISIVNVDKVSSIHYFLIFM